MTNSKRKRERGISLVSLVIITVILMIIANVIIYNVNKNLKLGNLTKMQNDIMNLKDKVSAYYKENGKIPANIKYTNISLMEQAGIISKAIDTGDFFVIDLSALENLTLNKGEDYKKVKENPENADSYTDLYIINEASQNVFYVAGVTVNNTTFYTDYTANDIDTASIDLKYIENVRIPDGFYYVEGTKDTSIIIRNKDNTQEYKWIQQAKEISELPNKVIIDSSQQEDFIKSVNAYKGYYQSTKDNKVIYLKLENWSPVYDEEGEYKDKNGNTAYIPKGFRVSETPGENTIHDGLVVKDTNDNEWVWIEVPKSIYKTAKSSEDYEKIEKDMQEYVKDYRQEGYTDTYYTEEQHGFVNTNEYNNWKKKMLKSVYEKGGFYLGRYEVGTTTARTKESNTDMTPMIQKDLYPYNYVTCKQAQKLSTSLATEGKTSSLMFGIQWDLVLKYIETKGAKTQSELKIDSTTWGNYLNSTFDITRKNLQYIVSPSTAIKWGKDNMNKQKPKATDVILTAGATNRNSTLNIYDLAGNMWEWTLETTKDTSKPCTVRSGSSHDEGMTFPVSSRFDNIVLDSNYSLGFRVVLY